MSIKAHCMGMEFPKRDTDSPNVKWEIPGLRVLTTYETPSNPVLRVMDLAIANPEIARFLLDAVAEEQRVKEKPGK